LLPAFGLFVLGIVVAGQVPSAGLTLMGLAGLVFVGVTLFFGVVSTIYKTVLYHWAATRMAPMGFNGDDLANAFAR
jgi:hypothetical protein